MKPPRDVVRLPDFIAVQIPPWSARPEISRRRRTSVLAVCCSAMFMVGVDNTSVNVALPSISRQLRASVAGEQWAVAAYTVALASLMLLSGSMGDRMGRRAVFQTGLATFTLGSWLCSLAPALGGAVGWRGIFWVNIPVGLAAIVLAAMLVPESRAPRARRPDPFGQLLVICMLGALSYAIIEAPVDGWHAGRTVGLFAAAAASLAVLVGYELRHAEPLIDPRFFRSVPFSGAVLTAICAYAALGGFLFLNSIYLQDVLGLSALHAGLLLLPAGAGLSVCAPVGGAMVARRGPRIPLVIAGAVLTLSSAALFRVTTVSPGYGLTLSYGLFGVGSGMLNAAITTTAVSGMPSAQAGVASGISSASRQVGLSLGVAITGSVLNSGLHGSVREDFAAASQAGWWVLAGCGSAVLLLGVLTRTRWALGTARVVGQAAPRRSVRRRAG